MAELADALGSGPNVRKDVGVRIPASANLQPFHIKDLQPNTTQNYRHQTVTQQIRHLKNTEKKDLFALLSDKSTNVYIEAVNVILVIKDRYFQLQRNQSDLKGDKKQ